MKFVSSLLAFLLVMTVSMAAAQTELKSAQIQPAVAAPGDSVSVQVDFSGAPESVKSVTILVREYPSDAPRFQLKQEKEKSLWTLKTRVPWDAPVQRYHLDIGAIDSNDNEIITSGYENNETGKTGSLLFEVK
jgi:hypothetical protein